VDALEALGDDRADAEQVGALRRPVARGARAVLLAGEDDERRALGLVLHRGVVDRHLLAVGRCGDAALGAGSSWFLRRMLAKVPRIITSWLPRRAP
jgi:hypothetical protein